jgi:hypothetical protein
MNRELPSKLVEVGFSADTVRRNDAIMCAHGAHRDEVSKMLVDQPRSPVLVGLTPTEERLIALYNPCVIVFAVQGIRRFTWRNVVFYERHVVNTACTPPRKVDDAGIVYIRDVNSSGEIWEGRVRPDRVFKALELLFNTSGRYWEYILKNIRGMERIDTENMAALTAQAEKARTVDENGEACLSSIPEF